jgi:short-subunit dehydrogenase
MPYLGKTYLITGASDGIGAELALQLAVHRPNLVLAARSLDKLEAIAAQCEAKGAKAIAVRCDVTQQADCVNAVAQAISTYSTLDVLVNNAGLSMHAWFDDISHLDTFETLFRTNVMSAIWCTHAALPHLKASKGLIVGVSSLAGKTGVPARTTYCTSKFAMDGFFQALRLELKGTGVDVCTIFPGVVATNIRRHGLKGDGLEAGFSGLKEEGAMSVQDCATQMIAAMKQRKRELIMTRQARIGIKLKSFAPGIVDNMALKALSKQGERKPV